MNWAAAAVIVAAIMGLIAVGIPYFPGRRLRSEVTNLRARIDRIEGEKRVLEDYVYLLRQFIAEGKPPPPPPWPDRSLDQHPNNPPL